MTYEEIEKIMTMNDIRWINEKELLDVGIDNEYLESLKWCRQNHQGKEYLACEVKGMLKKQELAGNSSNQGGFVDPYKLAVTLSKNFDDVTIDSIFEKFEKDPSLLGEYVVDNHIQRGIPCEKITELHNEGKPGPFSLDYMIETSESIKESIPPISIRSKNYNPFQALAFTLNNAGKMRPKDIAYEIGEDVIKIELFLYKNDLLTMPYDEIRERLKLYQRGVKESPESMETFSEDFGDMNIHEFVKRTRIPYEEVIKLTQAGLLENITVVDSSYRISKKITGRSLIYHLREILDGNPEYMEKVEEALSMPVDPAPRTTEEKSKKIDKDFQYQNKTPKGFISALKKIPGFTRDEEKEYRQSMRDCQKNILGEISTTKYMREELDQLYEYAKRNSIGFTGAFTNTLKKEEITLPEVRDNFMKQYETLSKLYGEMESSPDKKKGDLEAIISETTKELDFRHEITERALSRLKSVCWDLRIIDQQKRKYEKDSTELDSASGEERLTAKKKQYIKNAIKKLDKRKGEILRDANMSQKELEEKMSVIGEYEAREERLKHEFIIRNARLGLKFTSKNSEYFSNAAEGLMRAIELFDPQRESSFGNYASSWIKQKIRREKSDKGSTIRKPVHIHEKIRESYKSYIYLAHQLQREPTLEEQWRAYNDMSDKKISFKNFQTIQSLREKTKSLDEPINKGDSFERNQSTPIEFVESQQDSKMHHLPPDEELIRKERSTHIRGILDELTERERQVISMRLGIDYEYDHSLEEIGNDLGITRERVRQIELKAMRKLKHPKKSRKLEEVL